MKAIPAVLFASAALGLATTSAPVMADTMLCQGGGMTVTAIRVVPVLGPMALPNGAGIPLSNVPGAIPGVNLLVGFKAAAEAAGVQQPGPGECAWAFRQIAAGKSSTLLVSAALNPGALVAAAAKGGTFRVEASPTGSFLLVSRIVDVQVMDSTPLSPGPVNAENGDNAGAGAGGMPQTPADMGGVPPMQQAGGACGGGNAMATVVINQPGLDKLNVRTGPGGQVIGTVPEGATVSVVGQCGSIGGAAGFAKPATPQPARSGWCQISAPVSGCVSAQYLAFGGGGTGLPGGAAGLTKGKQPTLGPDIGRLRRKLERQCRQRRLQPVDETAGKRRLGQLPGRRRERRADQRQGERQYSPLRLDADRRQHGERQVRSLRRRPVIRGQLQLRHQPRRGRRQLERNQAVTGPQGFAATDCH